MTKDSDKKVNLQKPTGTLDFLPEQMKKRRELRRDIEDHFINYGYQQITTPLYEFFELFEFRSGEKIINDIFTFKNPPIHKKEEERLYCLRPELTAPIARFYITSELMYRPKPIKIFYIDQCFRYDKPAPGRYRQFTQAGLELFGADTAEADAEILIVAMDLIKNLKIEKYLLRLNDLTILRAYLDEKNCSEDEQHKIFGIIDSITSLLRKLEYGALEDVTKEDLIDNYYGMMNEEQIDPYISQDLENLLHMVGTIEEITEKVNTVFAANSKVIEAMKNSRLTDVSRLIKAGGITDAEFKVDCGIARGLDYYTDLVFEIDVPILGKQKQICGGGRYNKLIEDYGGEVTPATGFAFGFERLIIAQELQDEKNGITEESKKTPRSDIYIGTKEETREFGIEVSQKIRQAGIIVETDLMHRSFGASGKFINKLNIPFMLFIGPREKDSNTFTLKNFNSKEQFDGLSLEEVINIIKNYKLDSEK